MTDRERDTIRRINRRFMPIFVVAYMVSFIDRVNVGFAALTANRELGLLATAYGWGAGIFFLGYFLFEYPSNMMMGRVGTVLAGVDRGDVLARGVVVRINARSTPWHLADLAAAVRGRPAAVMLPKCVGTDDVTILDHRNSALEAACAPPPGSIGILPVVIESAASIHELDYRCAPARLQALCFGAEDLAADLGDAPRDAAGGYATPVRCARALTLLAATAAGVPALDTQFTNPRDPADLKREG